MVMLNYALAYLQLNVSYARSLTDVRKVSFACLEAAIIMMAIVMVVPKWGCFPYWYTKAKAKVVIAEATATPSGMVRLEQVVEGLPIVLDILINQRQARKVDEVLKRVKDFTVVKNYVIHHGPGAPLDARMYGNHNPDKVYVSCMGNTHPLKERHICPTDYPLVCGMMPYDKGWRLVIQDCSPLYM